MVIQVSCAKFPAKQIEHSLECGFVIKRDALNMGRPYFRSGGVLLTPQKTDDNKNKHDNDQNMHGGVIQFLGFYKSSSDRVS
jgi:hypothetical protein